MLSVLFFCVEIDQLIERETIYRGEMKCDCSVAQPPLYVSMGRIPTDNGEKRPQAVSPFFLLSINRVADIIDVPLSW